MLRRCIRRLGSTNRYTDGSGRRLESSELPRDLYLQTISNRAYPIQGEHWQPVLAGKAAPHKGSVVVSGGGVVGLTVASLFALRGWHTTVVEKSIAASVAFDSPSPLSPSGEWGEGDLALEQRPHSTGAARNAPAGHFSSCFLQQHPFAGLEYALVTRRAADVFESAGLRMRAVRRYGVPVRGVLDHPGAYNSWLTHGLSEHHPFAVTMLVVDLFELRRCLEAHTAQLPSKNLQIFHEHAIEAVYPLRQQVVVRPWEAQCDMGTSAVPTTKLERGADAQARTGQVVAVANATRQRRQDTSLTLSSLKWERQYAEEAVDYDLMVCAEGINSHSRELLDVEGFCADIDMGIKWFLLQSDVLSREYIHRWLHKRQTRAVTTAESYHIRSAYQVPMSMAFPRIDAANTFSVMVYMPIGELEALSDADVLRYFLSDVARQDPGAQLRSFTPCIRPAPTVFCENLYNSVGLPSAVMVGDAGHHCHPFWMQGLAQGLEDGVNLLNQVDAYSRHFYDAVRQYSDERGTNGDALRILTERCLHYQRRKHKNPLIRFQNAYQRCMNRILPASLNDYYNGSTNHLYSRSIEDMLNGRGYTSYDFAEKQQSKHSRFYHVGRVYT